MRLSSSRITALTHRPQQDFVLWDRAGTRPSLDLQFADRKDLVDATTGSNLIDFTRASSGTYVGSDGLIKTATTNLLLQSEEFDQSPWVTTGSATVTQDSSEGLPFPGATVYRFDFSGGGETVVQSFTYSSTFYAASIWVKGTAGETIRFSGQSGVAAENKTLTGSWQRLTLLFTGVAGSATFSINTASGATARTIWATAAQLEQSTTVGEYIPTTSTINSAPRFDHDPTTGESLGLLVEESRTNGIRNNTMVGASAPSTIPTNWNAATSAAGISFEVVGVGTESGISYIDIRQHGTPVTNGTTQISFEQNTTNAAASGETWTISSYCRLMAGTLPGITTLLDRIGGSGGSFLDASPTTIVPTGSSLISQRFTHVAALSNAATEYITARIDTKVFSGVPVDFTLRIGLPQLELGAFATSVIPTTSSTVTRAADVASISGSNFSSWYRQDEGTIYGEAQSFQSTASATALAVISDATLSNRWEIDVRAGTAGGAGRTTITSNGSNSFDTSNVASPVFVTNQNYKIASAAAANNFGYSFGGGVAVQDSSGAMPISPDRMEIGNRSNALILNGTIRRLTYWPTRLGNDTLQTITQ